MTDLGKTAMDYLRATCREVSFADGDAVVLRGQPGEAFYVVTSGTVEVLLVSEDGRRLPLARLSEGDSFGEMSLLTDEPVSADVVARGDAALLISPADTFRAGLAECAELRDHILARLCNDLRQTNAQAWSFFQRAEALDALAHTTEPTGPVIANSSKMREASQRIDELARQGGAALITGEAGAGKLFAARKIHGAAGPADAPLFVVDCSLLCEGEAGRLLFGSADRTFGAAEGSALQRLGVLDLAEHGTLILRHVDALDSPSQAVLGDYLTAASAEGDGVRPHVRVIATTCEDLQSLAAADCFRADLASQLGANALEMPSLLDRKRDILPLANLFLQDRDHRHHESAHHFNTSAENALVSAQYRHRNAAELYEAVEYAALLADGAEIGSEHVFIGPKDDGAGVEYDLGRLPLARRLIGSSGLTMARVGVLGFFGAIAAACIFSSGSLAGRIANGLVWGLWWPVLIVIFLLVGRAWCTVC
ncbi:MAG: cyclic nucleotide-binding domain-containing protein, partial [Planctomycetota bacterium]